MDDDELIKKILKNEVPLHKIEEYVDPEKAVSIRRKVIEKYANVSLFNISKSNVEYDKILNKNIENVIGSISMPLGVAGPIKINGEFASGNFYLPIATTEGALVASISRGIKAINAAGGANTHIYRDGMARSPVFEFNNAKKAREFIEWVNKNEEKISEYGDKTTSHGKIKNLNCFILGNNVWVRILMDTGDAMGMNMLTIASEAIANYIEENFEGAKLVSISGNMCSDKKESYVNELLGRGKGIVADCLIKKDILKKIFEVDAEKVNMLNIKKNLLGSSMAGSSKHNAHFANVIAGIFAATGQDLAQIVESSSGYTWTENRNGDLYISVTLPSLEVATVGGGTSMIQQKEVLSIMNIDFINKNIGENSKKLAEMISGGVLSGELNLLCALAKKELGSAHKKLGRDKKI
ncbi:MAG: hydroxymethylglutaryl-CoA reductase [Candidatus Micrarchaeaceae archaeon]